MNQELQEEITLPVAHGTVDITDISTMSNINALLGRALNQEFITPYIALEKVRQVLAYFSVHLEGTTKLFSGDEGSFTFAVLQFGGITGVGESPETDEDEARSPFSPIAAPPEARFIYFTWELNEEGTFDVWAEIVTATELTELITDEDEEDFGEDPQVEPDEESDEATPVDEGLKFGKVTHINHEGKKLKVLKVHDRYYLNHNTAKNVKDKNEKDWQGNNVKNTWRHVTDSPKIYHDKNISKK